MVICQICELDRFYHSLVGAAIIRYTWRSREAESRSQTLTYVPCHMELSSMASNWKRTQQTLPKCEFDRLGNSWVCLLSAEIHGGAERQTSTFVTCHMELSIEICQCHIWRVVQNWEQELWAGVSAEIHRGIDFRRWRISLAIVVQKALGLKLKPNLSDCLQRRGHCKSCKSRV